MLFQGKKHKISLLDVSLIVIKHVKIMKPVPISINFDKITKIGDKFVQEKDKTLS